MNWEHWWKCCYILIQEYEGSTRWLTVTRELEKSADATIQQEDQKSTAGAPKWPPRSRCACFWPECSEKLLGLTSLSPDSCDSCDSCHMRSAWTRARVLGHCVTNCKSDRFGLAHSLAPLAPTRTDLLLLLPSLSRWEQVHAERTRQVRKSLELPRRRFFRLWHRLGSRAVLFMRPCQSSCSFPRVWRCVDWVCFL